MLKRSGILLAALVVTLSIGSAQARDLTVVAFGGPIMDKMKQVFFEPFKQKTNIPYQIDEYNGEFAKIRSMVQAQNVTWDMIQVEHPELVRGCEEGLFQPLDPAKVGGKERFISGSLEKCGIPHIVWSMVFAYDGDKIKGDAPKDWSDFWNVEKFPGKRGLRQSAKPTLEAALLADGVPADKIYEVLATKEGVDRAFAKLDVLKPDIIWWKAGAQPMQFLAAGDVAMTSAYNGRVSLARQDGKNFITVWNGQAYDIDYWAIVNGSPNADLAYQMIDFASEPAQGAKYAELTNYGPPTTEGAKNLTNPELPTNPDYLKVGIQIDTEFWINSGDALEQRFQAWVGQ